MQALVRYRLAVAMQRWEWLSDTGLAAPNVDSRRRKSGRGGDATVPRAGKVEKVYIRVAFSLSLPLARTPAVLVCGSAAETPSNFAACGQQVGGAGAGGEREEGSRLPNKSLPCQREDCDASSVNNASDT